MRSYFLIKKKEKTLNDFINIYFSTLYNTLLPVATVYLFAITKNPFYLLFVLLPIFFKIEFEEFGDRIYTDKIMDYIKRKR